MLQGKIALITGAAHPQGIGYSIAKSLAKNGARIVLADIDTDQLSKSKTAMQQFGFDVYAYSFDVTNVDETKNVIDQVTRELGSIDILVNNVGGSTRISKEEISFTHEQLKPESFMGVTNVEIEQWHKIITVNLHGAYYVSKMVIPSMIEKRYGKIINISSVVARQGAGTNEIFTSGPYAVAKAGLIGLTRQMAIELGAYHINVNCIAPGVILSARGHLAKNIIDEKTYKQLINKIPLQRLGEVNEVAEVAYCLCTDMFSYVTGQTIDVNGGMFFS
jgi:NAD(P)-dependent dehydrogenase (short-subunit alcohol dehydrogenase family)